MSTPTVINEEYDIVIAGVIGGTAACVIAGRLAAADANLRVLLLKTGPTTYNDPAHTQPLRLLNHLAPGSRTPSAALGARTTTLERVKVKQRIDLPGDDENYQNIPVQRPALTFHVVLLKFACACVDHHIFFARYFAADVVQVLGALFRNEGGLEATSVKFGKIRKEISAHRCIVALVFWLNVWPVHAGATKERRRKA
ncbi:hypothetical protein EDB87DRAFT_1581021 [Lactarius vividus]|nr:hypothetical protein EDB87DRAFT_1581021 [Lactarius vividus]